MEELVFKAKQGDKEAYTKLILEIRNDLLKIARMRITNADEIEEVIQETMIESYRKIKQLREPAKFKFWVTKILINNCNKKYKKKKREKELYGEFDEATYIPSDDAMDRIENTLDFHHMLKDLSYEERMIMILFYSEKYTSKEIAKLLNLKENTVKSKLLRTKEKIKMNYKGGVKYGSV